MRFVEDHPDLTWGFCFTSIILQPGPPSIDVILEVLATNELLDLILEGDALRRGVTNVLVVPTVFVMVPLEAVSKQRIRPLKYPSLLRGQENILL